MSTFLHDADDAAAKVIAMPQVFSENSRAINQRMVIIEK